MSKNWLLALLLAAATPALAHDWYPIECCHGLDCAPVEKVEFLQSSALAGVLGTPAHASGVMTVTTKHGTVLVPANFPRRESKDHRMHVCMRPGTEGTMRLICIFMPPST